MENKINNEEKKNKSFKNNKILLKIYRNFSNLVRPLISADDLFFEN